MDDLLYLLSAATFSYRGERKEVAASTRISKKKTFREEEGRIPSGIRNSENLETVRKRANVPSFHTIAQLSLLRINNKTICHSMPFLKNEIKTSCFYS